MTMTEGITEFAELDPTEMHLVPAGANGFPFLLAKAVGDAIDEEREVVKACGLPECEVCAFAASKAKLDASDRNSLSDSDFAYIDSKGGRHLPIHDKAHVRNALARFNQTHFESAEAKAKAHRKIVARAKELGVETSDSAEKDTASIDASLSQTHDSETHTDVNAGTGPDPGDGGTPRSTGAESAHHGESDGEGDTAPDKTVPTGEAGSQTTKADRDDDGDDDDDADDTQKNALAEAGELISRANTLIEALGDRERAEKGPLLPKETEGAIRQTMQSLTEALTEPTVSKEEIDMDTDELNKLVGEAAAEAVRQDRAARKERKAAKRAAAAAQGGETPVTKAADAAEVTEDPASDAEGLTKAVDALREGLEAVAKRVEEIAEQPAARGPMLSEAGLGTAAPVMRQPAPAAGDPTGAFAELQKRIDEAPNESARANAIDEMARLRMIAAEQTRKEDPAAKRFGPGATPLFSNRHALPEDPQVSGI